MEDAKDTDIGLCQDESGSSKEAKLSCIVALGKGAELLNCLL